MQGWSCPHNINEICQIRNGKPCEPGYPGCILFGKMVFADPEHPSNKAFHEKRRQQRKTPASETETGAKKTDTD
ncbi:hypothetical protein [Chrysiogenes arsenatis]|uniref:hypothetical protein n=1 Tax=Chrysiogenes arsenatis TaxID=309797 RepID=UPI0003F8F8B0|nr:hypothetical protein [Chrysiogenes arsenatis]